jgi:hypothetical protein
MAATGDFCEWRGLPNTHAVVVNVTHYYAFADTNKWAKGIRNMFGEHPRVGRDTVHTGDVLAYQTCIALCPDDWCGLVHQWRLFYETLVLMFSIPGLYNVLCLASYLSGSISTLVCSTPSASLLSEWLSMLILSPYPGAHVLSSEL